MLSSICSRRDFIGGAAAAGAALYLSVPEAAGQTGGAAAPLSNTPPAIVDVFVDLFEWPFRTIGNNAPSELKQKLERHRVRQAWAGSYESLFHKNISRVNERLAEACRRAGRDYFLPFGTVNPAYPDWEEDLRRCHEVHRMPGIRLYPRYHGYTLDDPRFDQLVRRATERGLMLQIVVMMEDIRMQHPLVEVEPVDLAPLSALLPRHPQARIVLLNIFNHVRQAKLKPLVALPQVYFEISNLDGLGGLELALKGDHWYIGAQLPLERVLFGSHAPYYPLENALFKLFESRLTSEQFTAIAESNARRLLQPAKTSGTS